MKKVNLNALRMALAFVMVACLGFALFFAGTSPVKAEAEPQTRTYNETFDRLLDNGKGNEADTAYRSIVWAAGKCASVTNPVFKLGSPKISAGFDSLSIDLRSPDGSITLSDLKIGLRVTDSDDDTQNNHSYEMGGDDFIGGVIFSEGSDIGTEWSTMTIDFAQTETGLDSTSPDAMLAFHIYAKTAEVAGKLDISKVYVTTGAIDTVILDFDGVNESWWYGGDEGTFTDYPMGYTITESKQITSADGNLDEEYKAIVLNACGSGTVTVAPVKEDGTVGTAVAWEALTDLNGTSLPALTKSVQNYVISLESLGETKIKGIEVAVSGGEVFVAQSFFTNMESTVPDKYFPVLDLNSIAYMSQFNFEYLTAGPDYDKAVADSAAFNCDYILSYSAKNNVITDGHLVLDAQGEAFTSIKIRSKVASEGRRYAVIKYKLAGNATLNDFRFSAIDTLSDGASSVVYANALMVGNGLRSLSEANPYNGGAYSYLVIDLDKTFGTAYVSGFEFYVSGAGQILIDEIYFADACQYKLDDTTKHVFDNYESIPSSPDYWWTDLTSSALSVEDGALKIDVAAKTAVCVGGAKPGNNKDWNHRYMVIRMKSNNLDMETFRIVWLDNTTSNANQGAFKTMSGKEYVLTEDYTEMVIDLDESGINRAIEGFRLWVGGWNEEAGTLYIDEIYFADTLVQNKNEYSATANLSANENGYNYICGGDFANTTVAPFVELTFTALNTFKYDEIRVEFKGTDNVFVPASVLNLKEPVVLGDGEEAEMLTQTVILDLTKVGVTNYADITQVHAHMNNVNVDSQVTFGVKYFDYIPSIKTVTLPTNDDSKPVLEATCPETAKQGDEITITASATDNYTASPAISYEVTVGTKQVTVTNGKFTATDAGTYSIIIRATDEAGNDAIKTLNLVVSPCTEHVDENADGKCDVCGADMPKTDEPTGGCQGCSASGGILGTLILCLGAAVMVFARKKD